MPASVSRYQLTGNGTYKMTEAPGCCTCECHARQVDRLLCCLRTACRVPLRTRRHWLSRPLFRSLAFCILITLCSIVPGCAVVGLVHPKLVHSSSALPLAPWPMPAAARGRRPGRGGVPVGGSGSRSRSAHNSNQHPSSYLDVSCNTTY